MSLDSEILRLLRSTPGRPVPAAEVAKIVQTSRSTLSRHIEQLCALGYEIEASPHLGYRLIRGPDALHPDDILSRLPTGLCIGRDIRVFQETTSTNDVVEKLARDGVAEGAVVFAEAQNRGRGRLGRRWFSPAGKGLWFSVLLRPCLPLANVTQLTIASATALARAIRSHTEHRPEIKWPNDILLHRKKVAGVLMELSAELDTVRYVVLGIGLDANLDRADFAPDLREIATSLKIESGHPVDRAGLAADILRELDHDYARLGRGGFEAIADEWEAQCSTLGRDVTIRLGARLVRGRAESLDPGGALLLRSDHGHLERITGGDVTLEPN